MKLDQVIDLWVSFSDIPINDNDEILVPFNGFEAGTDRFVVWRWFEDQNPDFRVLDYV